MKKMMIMGLLLTDRVTEANKVQSVLTQYGCSIKTRLGMHEVSEDFCDKKGFVLLELIGEKKEWDALEKELLSIDGVQVKTMFFEY
jgi:hypothetical protein